MSRDMLGLPPEIRERLATVDLVAAGLAVRHDGTLVESRRTVSASQLEIRENSDGTLAVAGYAATYGTTYDVAGGPPWGYSETFAEGAFRKTVLEADVRFLVNHDGVPLARSSAGKGTMRLTSDSTGLLMEVDQLDAANPDVQRLVSALRRGDLDQMSHAFRAVRQEWNADYTERTVREAQLFDVSAVTFPANDATIIALRDDDTKDEKRAAMPLALAVAQRDALTLD